MVFNKIIQVSPSNPGSRQPTYPFRLWYSNYHYGAFQNKSDAIVLIIIYIGEFSIDSMFCFIGNCVMMEGYFWIFMFLLPDRLSYKWLWRVSFRILCLIRSCCSFAVIFMELLFYTNQYRIWNMKNWVILTRRLCE